MSGIDSEMLREKAPDHMTWLTRQVLDNPELFVKAAQMARLTAPQVKLITTSWDRGEHPEITNKITASLMKIIYSMSETESVCAELRDRVADLEKGAAK